MIRHYELLERVRKYNPHSDEALLNKAYVYAMKAHGNQKRASGDPYFAHPLEVAAILTEFHLDDATIVAAILHDTIEDTSATREEINEIFGEEIASLVDGLTKIEKLDLVSRQVAQAENLRKLLLAVLNDVRVLLIKLADRLHNMRTIHYVPQEKRWRVAQETLDIYAPLAGRMGIHEIREELEDLAFQELMPDIREKIAQRFEILRERSGGLVERIESELTERLSTLGLRATIKAREKRPYSIWLKMERSSIAFEQLSDIFGFRVIVERIEACYQTLGLIHTRWPLVPGRFKDYISIPKQNGYKSLHTTVVGPGHQRVEIQIRTIGMDEVAERGVAAHAAYKEGALTLADPRETSAYQWLQRTIDRLTEGDNPEEFLEHTKLELFHDQVFCFTPKGDLVSLPSEATVIDFAYALHTDIGHSAVGCRINGIDSPLISKLRNGDEVEIVRADAKVPPAFWEKFAVTGKARAAIRRAGKALVEKQFAEFGQRILTQAFEHVECDSSLQTFKKHLDKLPFQSTSELFVAVGEGSYKVSDVLSVICPEVWRSTRKLEKSIALQSPQEVAAPERQERLPSPCSASLSQERKSDACSKGLPISGFPDEFPVFLDSESGVIPGDGIAGILIPGKGVVIYGLSSPALLAFSDEAWRWLDVRWDLKPDDSEFFLTQIVMLVLNETGMLQEIIGTINALGAQVDSIVMAHDISDFREVSIDLAVKDVDHLGRVLSGLAQCQSVSRVSRKQS